MHPKASWWWVSWADQAYQLHAYMLPTSFCCVSRQSHTWGEADPAIALSSRCNRLYKNIPEMQPREHHEDSGPVG